MTNRVRVSTNVDPKAATELDKLRAKFGALQQQGAKGFMTGVGAAATLKAFSLIDRAIAATVDYIGNATKAFMEDERSQRLLRVSLSDNVAAWDGNTRAIEDVLAARMKLGFSDDEQRASLTNLVAVTKNVDKALEVQRTAMDLARMRGMSLADATLLLGKVAGGNVSILRRYGIAIDKGATSTEALALLQKMASGQAEEYAKTLEGRVEVAATKAAEAQEHLGENTASLSADFDEASASAIDNFVTGLDFLVDSLNYANQSTERKIELTKIDIASTSGATKAAAEQRLAELLAAEAAKTHGDELAALRLATNNQSAAAFDATDTTAAFRREMLKLRNAASDAESEIDTLSSTISDELFGDAINEGRLAELQQHRKELVKQRDETKKGSLEYKRLTGEIADTDQSLFDLHLTMAEKDGPLAAIAFLEKERSKAGAAKGKIDELIAAYRTLSRTQGTLGPILYAGKVSGILQERAAGGPVSARTPYLVGEQGPELFVPNQAGAILPAGATASAMAPASGGGWGGGGGAPVVIHLTVDGRTLARVVNDNLRYMSGRSAYLPD